MKWVGLLLFIFGFAGAKVFIKSGLGIVPSSNVYAEIIYNIIENLGILLFVTMIIYALRILS